MPDKLYVSTTWPRVGICRWWWGFNNTARNFVYELTHKIWTRNLLLQLYQEAKVILKRLQRASKAIVVQRFTTQHTNWTLLYELVHNEFINLIYAHVVCTYNRCGVFWSHKGPSCQLERAPVFRKQNGRFFTHKRGMFTHTRTTYIALYIYIRTHTYMHALYIYMHAHTRKCT